MLVSSFNEAILNLVDKITSEGKGAIYIQPKNSNCHLSSSIVTSTPKHASAREYPSITASLKRFFSPSSVLPAAGQVMSTPAIVSRSAGDVETDITAKTGQTKFVLYHAGGVLDFSAGKVMNVTYYVWTKIMEDICYNILAMAWAPRAGQLSSLLVRAHRMAQAKDQTGIFIPCLL